MHAGAFQQLGNFQLEAYNAVEKVIQSLKKSIQN